MATTVWIATGTGNDFDDSANWSGAAAPVSGDTLVFNSAGTGYCDGNLSTVLTGLTVIIEKSFTGQIGSVSGATATPLTINGGTVLFPKPSSGDSAAGSQRVMIACSGSFPLTVVCEDGNTSGAETQYPPIQLSGTQISLTQSGGNVGIAVRPGQVATVTKFTTSGSATLTLGEGTTITLGNAQGGTVTSRTANTCAALRVCGASVDVNASASGAHTLVDVDGGKLTYSGTGTITTLNLRAECDMSKGRGCTVTTCNTYKGYTLNVANGTPGGIVFTNAINHLDGISAGTLKTPAAVKGTLVAI